MEIQDAIDAIDEAWDTIKIEIRKLSNRDQPSEIKFTCQRLEDRLRAVWVPCAELWEVHARETPDAEWKTIWEGEDQPLVTFTVQQWCNAWRRGALKNREE